MKKLCVSRWFAKRISSGKCNQCAAIAADCCPAFTHAHMCALKACTTGCLAESINVDAVSEFTKIAIAQLSYNKFKMPSKPRDF